MVLTRSQQWTRPDLIVSPCYLLVALVDLAAREPSARASHAYVASDVEGITESRQSPSKRQEACRLSNSSIPTDLFREELVVTKRSL